MSMVSLLLSFIVCSGCIVFCGRNLSRYGDAIAEKTGVNRAWIGLILMATVTSLPELMTGISSVAFANTPNIALGDIMGSCVFNLAILALMDSLHGSTPLFSRAEHGHVLSAGFGIVLIGFSSVSILVSDLIPSFHNVGLYTPIIIAIYFIGVRSVFLFEKKKIARFVDEMAQPFHYKHITLRETATKYLLNAFVIIVAATSLPFISEHLAAMTGLGQSFFGTIFVAMTTSLPELVISVSALRIGATDMAIANLLGSNMFNILILAIDDIVYLKGPLLSNVAKNHAVTGFIAAMMTGIIIISLTYRLEKKTLLRLSWDAVGMLLAYGLNVYLLFRLRGAG
jgi:cation:H+ antiporter